MISNQTIRSWISTTLLALLATPVHGAEPLGHDLAAGPYAAGFEVIHTRDVLRPMPGAEDPRERRRIQISIWFPAEAGSGTAMTMADHVALTAREQAEHSQDISDEERAHARSRFFRFPIAELGEEQQSAMLALPTRSRRDASPAPGRFPLVVMAQGNHDPAFRHHVLAEHLASHGYVVASSPSASRYLRDEMDMNFGMGAYMDQVQDIMWKVDYMTTQDPRVTDGPVMLFGFSMGGNTGGYVLLRDPNVAGFICFDCGVGSNWGTPMLNRFLASTFRKATNRPLSFLHIYKPDERIDHSFMSAFERSRAWHFSAQGMAHFNFSSLGAAASRIDLGDGEWLKSGGKAGAVHDQSARLALAFLNGVMKGDEDALGRLAEPVDDLTRVRMVDGDAGGSAVRNGD